MSLDTIPELSGQVARFRKLIDQSLDLYTNFNSDCPVRLKQAIRYMLLAPGKRIRPLLTLFATQTCGGSVEDAIPAACAVEMIHTYSLIHDDLPSMDDDEFRRGQLTCHRKFDEATAILAGDALQALAFEVISKDQTDYSARCCFELAKACGAGNLVGGQVDDLAGCDLQPSLPQIERIHLRKTAALLTVSLVLGGIVGNADETRLHQLRVYGQNLGLAFQIVDDLLDLQGDETKMGKMSGKDRQNGTMTFPELLGAEPSRQKASELVDQAIDALSVFGDSANQLREIARFVLEREF